jgi:predicted metal-dependent peptidase
MIFSDLISASIMRIRVRAPFFGVMMLFANVEESPEIATAATDGKKVYFNPTFITELTPAELDGVMLHEVLHAALLHNQRRGIRDSDLWNVAADIVVNGIVMQQNGLKLPGNPVIDTTLEKYQVEEIYQILLSLKNEKEIDPTLGGDLIAVSGSGSKGEKPDANPTELADHWKQAWQQAEALHRITSQGDLPAELSRHVKELTEPKLDWKTMLWRFLVQTPIDFCDWDRRFIYSGMYLESLGGESLKAYVAIDTSGSIDQEILQQFIAELQGILVSYPHIRLKLYYADAGIYGPYELGENDALPDPKGGGGTRFEPFFKAIEADAGDEESISVYLTDGYGSFPDRTPRINTLWAVTPGGANDNHFPFGEVVRMK